VQSQVKKEKMTMLMQDPSTGYLHEVPESANPFGGVVYDGFGNPVGLLGLGRSRGRRGHRGGAPPSPMPGAMDPSMPPEDVEMDGYGYDAGYGYDGLGNPVGFLPGQLPHLWRRPWPQEWGWRRAPLPYTGLGPQRMYMRCAVWPGPKGLVPRHALTMAPASPAAAASAGRRRRRRR